ncbi:DUF2243 domain-containing protein [Brevundimonas sp.]|uniref:DUF2243 domain-containing protein n=1 Tax=Brevundimonas sp. TaxID=1871086 RepID=UPI001D57CB23|nr:DUF2243 domain-containing protein [Brevundimonas sp.]MBA4000934.1 DUF2243 domain-containing protein [Brevundimonas sp.]
MTLSRWIFWAIVLGFALGGFFDGILLHQILQWHHLLSLVPEVSSLRFQVLWDGYFHALMYVVGAVGLLGLWRARGALPEHSGLQTLGAILIGFGIWHVVDSVLSHWVLGIHRIKLDSPNPLMWDLIWFFAFGVIPVLVGTWLAKRGPGTRRGIPAALTVLLLGTISAGAGVWALQPPPDQPEFTTVVFKPGAGPEGAIRAMAATGARLVWSDPQMSVVVLSVEPSRRWSLYRHGAMLVSGSGLPVGCFDWSRA